MENFSDKNMITRKWSVWMADSVIDKFPELRKRWAYDYGVLCLKKKSVLWHYTGIY